MNLLEKQRDAGSHRPGNDHGQHQGKADTAGHRVSKTEGLALEKRDVKTDDQEGKDSQNHTVGETDPHFLPYQLQLLFAGEGLIHQDTDGNSQGLGTHIPCHVKDQRLEAHDDGQLADHLLKYAHDGGYHHAKAQQYQKPGETFLDALF